MPEERVALGDIHHPLGNHGVHVVYPESEEEIAAVLRYANESGLSVIPVGGGTKQGFGGEEEKADILLSLARMKGVVEHTAGDMTMTVRPGTTMQEIADHLEAHGQMLPIDAAWPEYATIGGVIASNDSGPKRMGYGSARDFVIGLRVVYPDGRVIRTGGKVVKNVAGYDMNKLFIGSMGTLGVISEVTVKLRPIPQYESLVLLAFANMGVDKIRSFAIKLLDSMMEPTSLELLSPSLTETLTGGSGYSLAIAFEDREKAVHNQVEWVKEHCPPHASIEILQQQEERDWWGRFLRVSPNGATGGDYSEIALKIGSKNLDVIENVEMCHESAKEQGLAVNIHGGVGHGISRAYVKGDARKLLSYTEAVRARVPYAVVTHMPFTLRKRCQVWGEQPSYFSLLAGIKQTCDPNGVLNPKRFVGGL
ncbi:MAG TPA: FAD-binding oxidoreductase [Bacillales bacterium]